MSRKTVKRRKKQLKKATVIIIAMSALLLLDGLAFAAWRLWGSMPHPEPTPAPPTWKPLPAWAVGAVIGAVLFRLIYAVALRMNMPAFMLKAVSSLIVVLALSGPYLRRQGAERIKQLRSRKEVG